MSAKCLDQQGRWRNKVVAFRMSPEEDELLETAVRLSGLTKQEYIIRRLQEKEVVVTGNPRVYKMCIRDRTWCGRRGGSRKRECGRQFPDALLCEAKFPKRAVNTELF